MVTPGQNSPSASRACTCQPARWAQEPSELQASEMIRVLHYVNQFFAGIGGEDQASTPPRVQAGPVGPGAALQQALGGEAEVVATLFCGDNYASEQTQELQEAARRGAEVHRAGLIVAGPA